MRQQLQERKRAGNGDLFKLVSIPVDVPSYRLRALEFHGQKDLGKGDFRKVPNGLPGVEDRMDLLHDGGVVGGRISKERWVEITSTAPATAPPPSQP